MKKEGLHIDASSEFDYSKVDAAVRRTLVCPKPGSSEHMVRREAN